ncbi:MAG TPA: bifunctional folylpolyglutamate synthase/dihydrofolate synthase [Candidatus Thioglobus sp.]|nr:bifunctional folylpolyglutamate synthase/dihydrofolate synthase [Candidatus Thioglobus sp.]HIL21532.1 bifunctional folylpolyglutamate synthase/dihydrofolate synthase [Candidatus Thioglobus sp.]
MGRLKTLDDWLIWQENLHESVIDLGLERIEVVYNKLFPNGVPFHVITVGGTNGKGSTIAFIDNVYSQSKHKVGCFTSPHLINYNERFAIDDKLASDGMIIDAFEKIEACRGGVSLSYFEFSTLAALQIFADADIDIAILEVGLGGRLDSVNVVDNDICVITNIAIDHTDYLGDTRELIGHEKAGIMRTDKLCICGDESPPNTLVNYARKINALLEFINEPYTGKIGLEGEHQKYNAAVALRVIETLQSQFPVSSNLIESGFEQATVVARFQKMMVGDKQVILDVAHNSAAVEKLVNTLQTSDDKTVAIFSALADKNIDDMISLAKDSFTHWFLVPLNVERAIQIELLHGKFDASLTTTVCQNMNSAIDSALALVDAERIVIFGSFHTITDATLILREN